VTDDLDPRIARTRAVVLDAATELLSDEGYEGFTVDAVVHRSGVAKTTIYRHWPTKLDLLVAAVNCFGDQVPTPDTGSLRDDLVALLSHLADDLANEQWSKSLPSIIERAEHDRELAEEHAALVRAKSSALREILERGQQRGEVRADVDIEVAFAALAGPLFFRRLVLHDRTSTAQVEIVVDQALSGLATSGAIKRRRTKSRPG
jgi:AcrR family transcriptional regulator